MHTSESFMTYDLTSSFLFTISTFSNKEYTKRFSIRPKDAIESIAYPPTYRGQFVCLQSSGHGVGCRSKVSALHTAHSNYLLLFLLPGLCTIQCGTRLYTYIFEEVDRCMIDVVIDISDGSNCNKLNFY